MRYYNTSGPVVEEDHYCIAPLDRVNVKELRRLVAWKRYFVLHAPRQTGKTSVLLALQRLLNAEGRYRCAYVNVEAGQAMRDDVEPAMQVILSQMALQAREGAGDEYLTSRPSRCVWAISAGTRCAPFCGSTPTRRAKSSRTRPWRPHGRRPAVSHGS